MPVRFAGEQEHTLHTQPFTHVLLVQINIKPGSTKFLQAAQPDEDEAWAYFSEARWILWIHLDPLIHLNGSGFIVQVLKIRSKRRIRATGGRNLAQPGSMSICTSST